MSNQLSSEIASKSIPKIYLKEADVYFTFSSDDQTEKVSANKRILAAGSEVFREMFFGPMKEGAVIQMEHSNADAFKEFLQFFYLNKTTLSMKNIGEVVRLA